MYRLLARLEGCKSENIDRVCDGGETGQDGAGRSDRLIFTNPALISPSTGPVSVLNLDYYPINMSIRLTVPICVL